MDRWSEAFWIESELSSSPALRVGFLLKQGLLQPEVPAEFRWDWTYHRLWQMKAVWDPVSSRLVIVDRHTDQIVYETSVVRVSCGRQIHVFFVDPQTGARFRQIVFYKERFGSREALDLKYPSQRITPADRREVALQMPEAFSKPWPVPPDPDVPNHAKPRGLGLEAERWRNSTEGAMSNVLPVSEELYQWARAQIETFLVEHYKPASLPQPRPWPADHLETGIWELQPRLDLHALQAAALFRDRERTMDLLSYRHHRAQLTEAVVSIDLRDPQAPRLVVFNYYRFPDSKATNTYFSVLELTPPDNTPQRRRYIICTYSGKRVDSVAFRYGVWASKEALRLENASQRSARYVNRIMRASVDARREKEPVKPQPRLRNQRR